MNDDPLSKYTVKLTSDDGVTPDNLTIHKTGLLSVINFLAEALPGQEFDKLSELHITKERE
jgi:hypothetical protein